MKLSEKWLRSWVDPEVDSVQLAEQLVNLGLEVDTVKPVAGEFSQVVVGEITLAEQHPNADRLRCCRVDIGASEPLSIVCGGVNARAGIKVAVATVGAVLPGDFKIKKSKLRGEPSHGMICSGAELGLGDDLDPAGGILELPADAPLGMDFREYYDLDDSVFDIELTPNRGDCASLLGVAREVAVANELAISSPCGSDVTATVDDVVPVQVDEGSACQCYISRVVRNIDNTAITPVWMRERLRRGGVRVISPVVDVLNYVMLELGQPLHAFDRSRISGSIVVRMAGKQERLKTLDEQICDLDEQTLVIADMHSPLAVAGIMGGLESGVTERSQEIVLEAAFFDPVGIRRSAASLGIQSESSYRFERGVDPELPQVAMARASELLQQIVGGEFGPMNIVTNDVPQAQTTVTLRYAQIERILGVVVPESVVLSVLARLGLILLNETSPWVFRIPSFRFDLTQEVDLIEEVARVYGYDAILDQPLSQRMPMESVSELQLAPSQIKHALVERGYSEAITYSFISPAMEKGFNSHGESIQVTNPISVSLSVMRQSLWPGLLMALQHNINRQRTRVRLFEFGRAFWSGEGDHISQPRRIAGVALGPLYVNDWSAAVPDADFFTVKQDVMALLAKTYHVDRFHWRPGTHSALHPGQRADIYYGDQCLGYMGVLHPSIVAELDLIGQPVLFELDWEILATMSLPQFTSVAKFPEVKRDLAVVVDERVSAAAILSAVKARAGNILINVEVFDIYTGKGIEPGQKSVALGLTFQDPSRTLIDSEVDELQSHLIEELVKQFNATMRA